MRTDDIHLFTKYARDFTRRVLEGPRRSELLQILTERGPYAWREALTDEEYARAVKDSKETPDDHDPD